MLKRQKSQASLWRVAAVFHLLCALALACSCGGQVPIADQKTFVSPDGRYWLRHEYVNEFTPTTSYSAIYIGESTGELRLVLKVDRLAVATLERVEWSDTPSSVALVADFQSHGWYRLHVMLDTLSTRLDRHDEDLAPWSPTIGILPEDGLHDTERVDSATGSAARGVSHSQQR